MEDDPLDNKTTIQVTKRLIELFHKVGNHAESYEDIIIRYIRAGGKEQEVKDLGFS